jgi:putative PIN family toxin of toxin-antitoxin system
LVERRSQKTRLDHQVVSSFTRFVLIRAIIDTNVFLSALWSRRGAAFEIFAALRRGRWQIVLSNHLIFEYEEVAKRNAARMGLTLEDIDDVLDALCAAAEQRQLQPAWLPCLSDPDDEPLLQMAVEARVMVIVTRNVRHLKTAETFGIEVMTPGEFLAKLRKRK